MILFKRWRKIKGSPSTFYAKHGDLSSFSSAFVASEKAPSLEGHGTFSVVLTEKLPRILRFMLYAIFETRNFRSLKLKLYVC